LEQNRKRVDKNFLKTKKGKEKKATKTNQNFKNQQHGAR